MNEELWHIVVAGGTGSRFGSPMPKQFEMLLGRPVIIRAIECLTSVCDYGGVVVAMNPDFLSYWHRLVEEYPVPRLITVSGGATRWESVKNALSKVPLSAGVITVHDAARPLASSDVVRSAMEAVRTGANMAVPAIPVTDSLRMVDGNGGSSAADRSRFRAVQTPQAFNAAMLRNAYALPFDSAFTDDASVMQAAGFGAPVLTEGSPYNLKITHPLDIKVAELYCSPDSMQ